MLAPRCGEAGFFFRAHHTICPIFGADFKAQDKVSRIDSEVGNGQSQGLEG